MLFHKICSKRFLSYSLWFSFFSSYAFGFFPKLSGEFGLRPNYRANPRLKSQEAFGAVDQGLIIALEAKANERTSLFMDLNMFNDRTLRAMGSQYQTSGSEFYYPNYSNYNFAFTSMYIKHDFNYFVFKGGRIRTPKWGQGLLLDGGRQRAFGVPYSTEGIHLSLDPEKGQAFGLFTGYDILVDNPAGSTTSGAKDVPKEHRFFFGVQSDSIQKRGKKDFYSDIGFYFGMNYTPDTNSTQSISAKFMDVYFNLLAQKINLKWSNELLYRTGAINGVLASEIGGETNSGGKLDNLIFATNLEWTFFKSGSYDGPLNLRTGDLTEQKLFMDLVYLPGAKLDETTDRHLAFKANKNFKKTLILFSGINPMNDDYSQGGIYNARAMMNTTFFSFGYSYESLNFGKISAKASMARLNDRHGLDVSKPGKNTFDRSLGVEVDAAYTRSLGKDFELTAEAGMLFPGDAWKSYTASPQNTFAARATLLFKL